MTILRQRGREGKDGGLILVTTLSRLFYPSPHAGSAHTSLQLPAAQRSELAGGPQIHFGGLTAIADLEGGALGNKGVEAPLADSGPATKPDW